MFRSVARDHIVFDVLDPIGDLHDAARGYPKPVPGEVRHRQRDRIDVLVDGGSKHGAWVVIEIGRVVWPQIPQKAI